MYSLAVGSVTTAMKGKDILQKNGISSSIQRYSGEKQIGCGYAIVVKKDADRCVGILRSAGIKVLDVKKR